MTLRDRARHTCLVVFLAAATAAFALSYESSPAWVLLAFPAAALAVTLPVLPASLTTALLWTSRLFILLSALAATGLGFAYVLGIALAVLAGVFLLGPRSFSMGGAFLPAALAVFLLAAANPLPSHLAATAWIGGAALVLWLLSQSALAAHPRRLLAAALFLLPAVAIGEGILRFLPWAQPHVEAVAFRYMGPQSAEADLGLGSSLGSIEQLALSPRVVLRLWSDHPLALRAVVFTRFTGRYWQPPSTTPPARTLAPGAAEVHADGEERVPGRWLVASDAGASADRRGIRIVVESPLRGALPAPASVRAVRMTEPSLRVDAFGILQAPARDPEVYGVIHAARPEPAGEPDATLAAEYLQPPPLLDPRVRALAAGLGPADASVLEKVDRTVAHLHSGYLYSLKVGRWKTNDPLAEFLFDKKKGYCEYFATAAVVLLRLQGVPARYVSGLSVREANRQGDHYLVRAGDAHAWAEALVPDIGWREVDATPPGQYAELHTPLAPTAFERWMESLKSRWAELTVRGRVGGWGALLGSAGGWWIGPLLAAAAGIAFRQWRRRSRAAKAAVPATTEVAAIDPELHACLTRLEQLWTSVGHPRPPHRGPLEHVQALPAGQEPLRRLSLEVVDSFYRGAYGGQAVPAEETARLRRALSGFVTAG